MPELSRREFCRTAAATAVLASTAMGVETSIAGDAEKPFQIRYALASCMYGKLKLADIVPEVVKTGAECLDLWPMPHGNQREQMDALGTEKLLALLSRFKTRLGMTTRFGLGPFGLADELRRIGKLGGRLVVTGSVKAKDISAADTKAAVSRFVERMKPHVAVAEECGLTIGIENHDRTLIHSPDSLRYLADLSPSPKLGIALAPYHLPQDAKLIAGLIADLGPKLVHFYAWQHGHGCTRKMPKAEELEQMPGRGSLDFRPLLETLRRIDYRGWTEIFMHPTPRGIPIRDSAAEVTAEINRARKYLEDCLS